MSDDLAAGMIALFAIIAFGVGMFCGSCTQRNQCTDEAVKIGHAEYYLDSEHNRQWRWKARIDAGPAEPIAGTDSATTVEKKETQPNP